MDKRRTGGSIAGLLLVSLLAAGFFAVFLGACGQAPSSPTSVAVLAPTTSTAMTAITATSTIVAGKPIEIQRFEDNKELWKAWIDGDTVVWMESAGPAAKTGLAYSATSDWDTVFRSVPIAGGDAQEVPGVRLLAPKIPGATPWGLTLPLAWAELLPASADAPAKLVWASPPPVLSQSYLLRGLSSWSPGGTPLELLPASSVSLRAQASGDAIAIPIPVASVSGMDNDGLDPANWDKLLMMTANTSAPVEVDPVAPQLPEAALAGLSPYFSLLTTSGSGGSDRSIFDLRTGEKVALALPASPLPYPLVAGYHAAWFSDNGDVYLADLDAPTTSKVLSLGTDRDSMPSVALGNDWLVALKPWSSFDMQSAMANPSEHPGADLIAIHLPDLRRVDIPAVIPKGEVGSVQISGDIVLLTVSPAVEPIPHNEPPWVALEVLRLE